MLYNTRDTLCTYRPDVYRSHTPNRIERIHREVRIALHRSIYGLANSPQQFARVVRSLVDNINRSNYLYAFCHVDDFAIVYR